MRDDVLDKWKDETALVARVLLMILFVISGWAKLTDYSGTVASMGSANVPLPEVATIVAIVIELFGGIAIIVGFYVRPLALIFVIWTLCTALVGHHFWTMAGVARVDNQIHFLKNISIMGGLLVLSLTGPGRYSIDRK